MSSKYPVTLVIADAGPLISLACADRLDLLSAFGTPVATLDVVRAECLQKEGTPGQERLRRWFDNKDNGVDIINSPILPLYQEALTRERDGTDAPATEGLGDAAISWFVAKAPRLYGRDTIVLVLTEDGPFGDTTLGRNVHVLSTRPFLKTLENLELIQSALDVINDIKSAGRTVPKYQADRPALVGPSGRAKSNWTTTAVAVAAKHRDQGTGR